MAVSNVITTTRTVSNDGKIDIDIEDEISFVLHEFRQSSSSSSATTGPSSNIIKSNNRNSKSHRGHFSDVRYYRKNRTIEVSYLLDKVLLFEFEICIQIVFLDVGGDDDDDDGDDNIDDNHTKNENKSKINNHYKKCYTVTYQANEDYSRPSISSTECSPNNTKFSMKEKISILKRRVQIICDDLNYRLKEETEQIKRNINNKIFCSSTSLFAVLSKLLLLLNNLQMELLSFHKTNNNEKDHALVLRPMTDRERSSHIAYLSTKTIMMTTTAMATTGITRRNNNKEFHSCVTVDLALLLLRFALVGKHRDVFLNPLPSITTEKESNQSFENTNVANTIWFATEYRRRYRQKKQQRQQQQRTSLSSSMVLLHPIEQELFGFLYALPWIKRGKITATLMNATSSSSSSLVAAAATVATTATVNHEMIESNKKVIRVEKKNVDNSGRNRIVIEVCLDLESNITTASSATDNVNKDQQNDKNDEDDYETRNDSYYSPRFAHLCKQYGVVTVYHGTHIDHVWSILNNGFWNMSDNPLFCKNGAIMGSGVYLSTSKKVATFFATNNSSKNANKIRTALKHDSLRNILLLVENGLCFDNDKDCDGNGDVDDDGDDEKRKKDLDELYDISCYSVFEARIIRPPNDGNNNNQQNDNKNGDDERAAAESSKSSTRRDGKYYVVPNGHDIRITRLYLTFELTRKRSNFLLRKFSSLLPPNNNNRSTTIVYYAFLVVLMSIFLRYVTTRSLV